MEENKDDKSKEPEVYEVPAAGSLALLALGYHGLEIWRKKRDETALHSKNEEEKKNNSDK